MNKPLLKTITLLLFAPMLFSCSKKNLEEEKRKENVVEPEPEKKVSRVDRLADSLFYYAQDIYFWNDQLPTYEVFNPRQFSKGSVEFNSLNKVLFNITRYGTNPATGKPYEYNEIDNNDTKYSYIDKESYDGSKSFIKKNELSNLDLEGNGDDLGLKIGLYGVEQNYKILVQMTYPGSPAAISGLQRGDIITEINGVKYGTNFNHEVPSLSNALFESQSAIIKGKKSSGTPFEMTLNKIKYQTKSVIKDSIYLDKTKKVGYFVFNSFSKLSHTQADLTATFNKFQHAGITDLIIDLRYNGGGYINTAEFLANKIAPNSLNGKVMFTENFNSTMQNNKTKYLKNLSLETTNSKGEKIKVRYTDLDYSILGNTFKFNPTGNININTLVFIVTENTASASELLINIFKPHLNVKIVGAKTYGKPIGFFPLTIGGYDVYFSMFESRNASNESDYYNGISVNKSSNDDAYYPFGNLNEQSFKAAYDYIVTGNFSNSTSMLSGKASGSNQLQKLKALSPPQFKGMIENRIKSH
ncbi:S41 family peptidase [Sphingobacterium faecium]|jgi:carboxyl-terminal processing protease|uniref:S41 family peptidase n=1 Tax=Sphingobacterium faecium TaxID=34087 RepID=UPI00320B4C2C